MRFAFIILAVFVMISMLEEMDAVQCPYKEYKKNGACHVCDCHDAATRFDCKDGTGQCYCPKERTGRRCDQCSAGHYFDRPYCRSCNCDPTGAKSQTCTTSGCTCHTGHTGFKCNTCLSNFIMKSDGRCEVRERSFKFGWVWSNGTPGSKYYMHVTIQCNGNCIVEGLRIVKSNGDLADVDMYANVQKWAKAAKRYVKSGRTFCKAEGSSRTAEKCDYKGTLGVESFHVLFISRDPFVHWEFKFKVANYQSVSNTDLKPYVSRDESVQVVNNYLQGAPYNGKFVVVTLHCYGYCDIKDLKLSTSRHYRADVDMYASDDQYKQDMTSTRFTTDGNEFCDGEGRSQYTETCTATGKTPNEVDKYFVLLYSSNLFHWTDLKFKAYNFEKATIDFAPRYNWPDD